MSGKISIGSRGKTHLDSKKRSILESILDVSIGFIISTMLNFTILPLYIQDIQMMNMIGMLQISLWYTITSLIRKYVIRRLFENLRR